MKCELQPSLLPVQLHGREQMQVQVLLHVPKPLLLPEMVLLVELVSVSEQVPVSMPDPPVDQIQPGPAVHQHLCDLEVANCWRDQQWQTPYRGGVVRMVLFVKDDGHA